jgi:hypothetical protein
MLIPFDGSLFSVVGCAAHSSGAQGRMLENPKPILDWQGIAGVA